MYSEVRVSVGGCMVSVSVVLVNVSSALGVSGVSMNASGV